VKAPSVVDLYAGAGGLSLGFEQAGAKVVMAVEADAKAARTYRANHPDAVVLEEQIDETWNIARRMEDVLEDPYCDLLIGGPPCQGWSTIGARGSVTYRTSLNASIDHFLAQASLLRPPAVVMENVRGLATRDGGKHLKRVVERLEDLGYDAAAFDVSAADFGVPQLRHRVFVVATLWELRVAYDLYPSHPQADWMSVWEAIGDLPSIEAGESANAYRTRPQNAFQERMRGDDDLLTWHESPNHSAQILAVLSALRGEGASRSEIGTKVHLTSGFHNTYCRLWSNKPAPAITSSAGRVSSGRNAHPVDDRALTPREAARLQTFPDRYRWEAERWPVYQQIGNAVPPMLAEAVAHPLVSALKGG
jgi:DNA (cytosine-5)-methyltransferase 1